MIMTLMMLAIKFLLIGYLAFVAYDHIIDYKEKVESKGKGKTFFTIGINVLALFLLFFI